MDDDRLGGDEVGDANAAVISPHGSIDRGITYASITHEFHLSSTLVSIVLPDTVTSIGKMAFYRCTSLSFVFIPSSVIRIGDRAFFECISLKSIIITRGVVAIGSEAFSSCFNLESIILPHRMVTIGYGAFAMCDKLSSINIPQGITVIKYVTFYGCITLSSVTIPDSVTAIEGSAFGECTSLLTIIIPETVTSMGSLAFIDCLNLSTVVLPLCNTMRFYIERYQVFSRCLSLSNVILTYHSGDLYGVLKDHGYIEVVWIKAVIDHTYEAIDHNTINSNVTVVDMDVVSKMEYILWLMDIGMNEYIDDWKGPHSLLVTSYLLSDVHRDIFHSLGRI